MSFYTNQEIVHTIEFERTREAQARRQFLEARRLARKNRRSSRPSQWIGTSVIPMGARHSEEMASSAARNLVAKIH